MHKFFIRSFVSSLVLLFTFTVAAIAKDVKAAFDEDRLFLFFFSLVRETGLGDGIWPTPTTIVLSGPRHVN